ncbi:MAG TPA: DNA-deoxyinosine glycosylase [Spirochaetia bacterium]|nr:DNA-deoxyinosine glycosylase [Spirochaetales bacterium]HRS65063.1 DNA-deoxyinosine glycosylase [Spirochaetia bacterium]HOT59100.1 DNA-deoxyinosine glycosylase [Spirochaetales bacterium]HPD80418.1 DNA-deoxyinosine glycosylase [Spirochaetales bacterium]HQK34320.1 DNA-deoxyinosine glycosylase [Spirochaetales bacterium]
MYSTNDNIMVSFLPLVHADTRVLILGSFPGKLSLERNEYYGNPKNHFWELVFSFLEVSLPINYQEKLDILEKNRIGLWDIVASCSREGSSDSAISNPTFNTLCKLFADTVSLKTVLCNGSTSFRLACKSCEHKYPVTKTIYTHNKTSIVYEAFVCEQYGTLFLRLPSTSPIPTRRYKTRNDKTTSSIQSIITLCFIKTSSSIIIHYI